MEDDEVFQLVNTLKSQIIIDEVLTDDYEEVLRELYTLINEHKSIIRHLEKSDFMNDTLLLTLRYDKSYDVGLQFITEMIGMGAKIPGYFFSKNFVFFITEKLYQQMEDSSTNVEFVTALIKRERVFISIFEECGYFVLVNSLCTEQTCRLYSQIFSGYEFHQRSDTECLNSEVCKKNQRNEVQINEDVMFEIHRKNFDSEIVFREHGLIKFKPRQTTLKKGNELMNRLFVKLYNSNFYNLLEISLTNFIDVLSYKTVKCDWLLDDPTFLDLVFSGNLAALRVMKNIIRDCGSNGLAKLEEMGYISKAVRLLEEKSQKVIYETTVGICLYLTRSGMISYTIFTEKRIRAIFSLLEYHCVECPCENKFCSLITESSTILTDSQVNAESLSLINTSPQFSINMSPSQQDSSKDMSLSLINTSPHFSINMSPSQQDSSKDMSDTIFPSGLPQPQIPKRVHSACLESCQTMRILDLIFKIYNNHKKEYFYKISYMILLKSISDCLDDHNCFNKNVFNLIFSDFINFLISQNQNFSRVLFPFNNKKNKEEHAEHAEHAEHKDDDSDGMSF